MQSQKEHTASTQKGQAGFEPRTFIQCGGAEHWTIYLNS